MAMTKTAGPVLTNGGVPPFQEGRIKIRVLSKANIAIRLTMLILAVLTIVGFATFNYQGVHLLKGLMSTLANFKTIFFQPQFAHFTLLEAIYQLFITLSLGVLTTLIGAIIALFLGMLAAENLSNKTVSNSIKGFVAVIRAVPTVLWVLIFAVSAGLGSVAAVIGMSFHSISYLTKAYSESFEELNQGTIEALEGCGASWWQIVCQAVLPSSLTSLISWTFIRFEINFGVSVAMGAAAGAGGIGYDMFMDSAFYYNLHEMGVITYLILIVAMLLEFMSIKIKNKVRA
ncbi:phosphonate transport system permease protein [Sporolactobacillus nakayamae]|uniref:Phosphonate transport system permease protein n=2 Tax=Sporolactobacillus nakayamae TaxID=269670 RepID=A0A1I2U221_9BACL|nr:phosphonate transport system permease protein [Sporolactobacillus nakayamae]